MIEFIQDCGFDSYLRSKKNKTKQKTLKWKPQAEGYTQGEALSEKQSGLLKGLKFEKPVIRLGMGFCTPTLAP